ncbi:MAG: hypothetical protein ACI38Q_04820 [Candidatus Bruticola sp.]
MSVFSCNIETAGPLTFFNWRNAMFSFLHSPTCLCRFLPSTPKINPTFSVLSFQDGYPNRWDCGAFALPLSAYLKFADTDTPSLNGQLYSQERDSTWNIQLSCPGCETVYNLLLELRSPVLLTLTPSERTWAELCQNTLDPDKPLPEASAYSLNSRSLLLNSIGWRRTFYRLQWLEKASWLLPEIAPDECTKNIANLCAYNSVRRLLAQAESLCFNKVAERIDKKESKLSSYEKRLEGQLSNLLKDFHNFYKTTKILSGNLASQRAMLRLAQAVGYALNLYA